MRITSIPAKLALVPAILVVMSSGCATTTPEVASAIEQPNNPDFFVANRWVDVDRSGGADYWEFEGANKWTFRSDERVTFVSRIECNTGSRVHWKLHAPDGEVLREESSEQRWPSTWRREIDGPVVDLLDLAGAGVWWVEWFVAGVPVGKSAANLVR